MNTKASKLASFKHQEKDHKEVTLINAFDQVFPARETIKSDKKNQNHEARMRFLRAKESAKRQLKEEKKLHRSFDEKNAIKTKGAIAQNRNELKGSKIQHKEQMKAIRADITVRGIVNAEIKKRNREITANIKLVDKIYKGLAKTADSPEDKKVNFEHVYNEYKEKENNLVEEIAFLKDFHDSFYANYKDKNLVNPSNKLMIIESNETNVRIVNRKVGPKETVDKIFVENDEYLKLVKNALLEFAQNFNEFKELVNKFLIKITDSIIKLQSGYIKYIGEVNYKKANSKSLLRDVKSLSKNKVQNSESEYSKNYHDKIKRIKNKLKVEKEEIENNKNASQEEVLSEKKAIVDRKKEALGRIKDLKLQEKEIAKKAREEYSNILNPPMLTYNIEKKLNDVHLATIDNKIEQAKILAEVSYDGNLNVKIYEAKKIFLIDKDNHFNELLKETNAAKNAISQLSEDNNKLERLSVKDFKEKQKEIFIDECKRINKRVSDGEISKRAKKELVIAAKRNKKEAILTKKLNLVSFGNKEQKRIAKVRFRANSKADRKIYGSKVTSAYQTIPVEGKNGIRFLFAILSLILPGSVQLIYTKQWVKGIGLAIITVLIYAVLLPYILGITNIGGNGIFGFSDLGKSKYDFLNGVFPDARYYLFEGVLSVIFLALSVGIMVGSCVSGYRTGKYIEQGIRPNNWAQTKKVLNTQGFPYAISIPAWILMTLVIVVPVVVSLLMSFTNIGFNHTPPGRTVDWVGLSQYGRFWILRDAGMMKSFGRVLSWTFIWTFGATAFTIFLGGFFAILVNQQRIRGKVLIRMIYIIPWAIPAFITILFLKSTFQASPDSLWNMILLKIHFIDKPVDWWSSIWTIRILLIIIQGWIGHAYIFLLITGNLQSIPKTLEEVAAVEGASGAQKLRYLTIPLVMAQIAPLIISQFTMNFNNFTIISMFSNGNPAFVDPTPFAEGGTDILISWIYKLTTGAAQIDGNMAFAAALTIIASLFSVGVSSYAFVKSGAFREE